MALKIYSKARFGIRADSLENWQTQNPILAKGEPSLVLNATDGNFLKFGDGETDWNNLPFYGTSSKIEVDQEFLGPGATENPQGSNAVWQAIGAYFVGEGAEQIQTSMSTYFEGEEGATRIQTAIENSGAEMQNYKINEMTDPTSINDVNYPTTQAVANYVTDQIGSIETALDSVIAIQNEIIGGGSV